ncbi:hypothetical protein EDB83DRAFT_2449701 [Lactarius deliciosus]|nr:hypothetical protein EDB83DRAFT_2449701 [Lactarius deliciosus]
MAAFAPRKEPRTTPEESPLTPARFQSTSSWLVTDVSSSSLEMNVSLQMSDTVLPWSIRITALYTRLYIRRPAHSPMPLMTRFGNTTFFGGSSPPYQRGQLRSWTIMYHGPDSRVKFPRFISLVFQASSHLIWILTHFPSGYSKGTSPPTNPQTGAREARGVLIRERGRRDVRVHTRARRTIDP